MFGGLRKKLNEVWSGADFWDKKENTQQRQQFAQTRTQPQPKPAPARTISQPRQAAPSVSQRVSQSYGTGFSRLGNQLRDFVDPNTQADKIRRFATTGLEEDYQQEQTRKTQAAMNSNAKRNGLNEVASGGLAGVTDFFGKGVGSLAQVQGRVGKAVNSIDNPVLRTGAKLVAAPNTLFTGEKQSDRMLKTGQSMNQFVENKKQQSSIGQRKDDNRLLYGGGQVVAQLPAQIATGGIGLVNTGAQTAAEESNRAQQMGRTNNQALGIGLLQGGVSAVSEKLGVDKFLPGSGVTGRLTTKLVKRAATEGAQEAQQQFTQNLIANKTYNPSQSLKEGVAESAVLGAVAGGAMSPISDVGTRPKPTTGLVKQNPTPSTQTVRPNEAAVLSDLQDVLTGRIKDPATQAAVIQEARNVQARTGIDVTTGSPADIQSRINQVLEQPQNSRKFSERLGLKPLNEGGYINFGGGKTEPSLNKYYRGEAPDHPGRRWSQLGSGLYMGEQKVGKNYARDGKIMEYEVPQSANIVHTSNPDYQKIVNEVAGRGDNKSYQKSWVAQETKRLEKQGFSSSEAVDIANDRGKVEISKRLAAKGYDGIAADNLGDNNLHQVAIIRDGIAKPLDGATPFSQNVLESGGRYDAKPKPKGLVVSETKPINGQVVQKVRTGPGKVEQRVQDRSSEIADALGIPQDVRTPATDPDLNRRLTNAIAKSDNGTVKDYFDQKDYGVKDIQQEPTNTIQGVFDKYLQQDILSDAELNQSNRTGVRKVRDVVGKANPLRFGENLVGKGFEKLSRGGRVSRAVTRAAQYINKTAGQDPAMLEAAKKYAGDSTYADASLVELGGQAYKLLPDAQSRQMVHAVLDPEAAKGAVKFNDLTPEQQQAATMLRDLGDAINDTSFRAGMISRKKWESNRGGRYIARLYSEIETAPDVADLLDLPDSRGLFLGMYKSRVDLNDALRQKLIKDPVKLAVIRARQVRSNEALMGYMREAEQRGYVQQAPTKGYVKVSQEPGGRMHNWNGKYVRQDVYENINGYKSLYKGANALNNLLDIYDQFPPRRLRKKMLTVYNPVVRTGNVTSNYFFAYLNGINPITYQRNKVWAQGMLGLGKKKSAMKRNDPLVIAAQRAGLIGNDIVSSDKNLFSKDKEFGRDLARASQRSMKDKVKGTPRAIDDKATERYRRADDVAKLAALKSHVARGYSVNDAIKKTARGFQDYSRVGYLYDMAAKFPVFGNAFVRFQGDLYTNILKNAAVDHPLRLAALPAAIMALGNGLSTLSGESEEDKKTREDRAGAPKIPFTNISTEFQTPWGAVDVARFTPLYMRQDVDGNSIADQLSDFSPFNVPDLKRLSTDFKGELTKKAASDPLIGPLISLAGDTDWRGKSISDPEGVRDGKQVFPDDPLSSSDRNRNRGQYIARSYLPWPFNEIGDIQAAAGQNKKNEQTAPGTKNDPFNPDATLLGRTGYNTSGSKKSVGQAAGRLFGVRAQQYGKKEAEDQRERNKMFEYFDKVDEFKRTLDSGTQAQFDLRHKSNATRSGLKKELIEDPWYKYKNAGELLQNPKLFEAEKKYAQMQNKYDGRPIDPIFNLPPDQRNTVLAKKLKLPGSKDEGFNTLYDQPWYQDFRKQQDVYYKAKNKYKEKLGFADVKETNPYPEAPQDVQKHIDFYFSLPEGDGPRGGNKTRSLWIQNNPEIWDMITGQWDRQNAWTDEERKRLGLPAIEREDQDKKFAKTYGSSGGRKGGRKGGRRGSSSKYDYTKNLFGDTGSESSSTTKALRAILEKAMKNKA